MHDINGILRPYSHSVFTQFDVCASVVKIHHSKQFISADLFKAQFTTIDLMHNTFVCIVMHLINWKRHSILFCFRDLFLHSFLINSIPVQQNEKKNELRNWEKKHTNTPKIQTKNKAQELHKKHGMDRTQLNLIIGIQLKFQ